MLFPLRAVERAMQVKEMLLRAMNKGVQMAAGGRDPRSRCAGCDSG